jgi:hypothetical protein
MNESNDSETEQPLTVLLEQERETSAEFIEKLRSRIHRRSTVSQFTALSWHLPKVILAEIVGVLGHLFSVHVGNKESRR